MAARPLAALLLLGVVLAWMCCVAVNPDYDLLKASEHCDKDKLLRVLSEKKAQIHARNNYGVSSILFAANNGHLECVEVLLANGADINDRSNNGKTPLLWAALWGHVGVVKYLVQRGANLDIRDKDQLTVLMSATMSGSVEMVRFLLANGANVTALNTFNGTALSIAEAKGHTAIAAILSPHFADESESPYWIATKQLAYYAKLKAYELFKVFGALTLGWEKPWNNIRASTPRESNLVGTGHSSLSPATSDVAEL